MKHFNNAGPCRPEDHYMLPVASRLPEVRALVDQKSYFVIHAPRQIGKTTTLMQLAEELTAEGRYTALLVSAEVGSAFSNDPGAAELAMIGTWRRTARIWLPADLQPPAWPDAQPGERVSSALTEWALASARPLVIFLDEIDSLENEMLLSVLRQLRDGFRNRPRGFPWSLGLIGMRDVRDYKVMSGGSDRLDTASPFNVLSRSLTMKNFTADEVASLYRQHTDETGQVFTDEAIALSFHLTQGQPYLVNALAKVAVEELQADLTQPITPQEIEQSKQILIERQETHLNSLVKRLREPRIRNIIEPILAGQSLSDLPTDDLRYALDLGLVRSGDGGGIVIANPIYREVIPTMLAYVTRASLPQIAPVWLNADGTLNPDRLLESFLAFWRQHGQPLLKSVHYHEIAPYIVMMAFLHRVVNGGGSLEREYAIGTRRMDVCLRYGDFTLGMELKVWRDGKPDPLAEGLAQLDLYLDGLGLATGWLVIFDQRGGLPEISERTSSETAVSPAGRTITVIHG
ncbi:MAG TPA: ATP-binding protein [Blastocatellia bacterium]|nr:ATP-binding protein [Blastocatellia bacterium]HMV82371.1 ATP-binding protein [Blastocatellia bacterium]HMZ22914.1 ATP-binding protein [Blastocatellia bacterium]HNG30358.1 ATP-binding protein [Blastocatellia bacterium]